MIYKVLERVTSLSEAKGHAKEFEHLKGCDDGNLLDVLRRNRHLIVIFLEVQRENTVDLLILEVKLVMLGRG